MHESIAAGQVQIDLLPRACDRCHSRALCRVGDAYGSLPSADGGHGTDAGYADE